MFGANLRRRIWAAARHPARMGADGFVACAGSSWRVAWSQGRYSREHKMIWNSIETQWNHLSSQLTATWGKLTVEDLEAIAGKKERLIVKLQERYGIVRDDAAAQVYKWIATVALGHLDRPVPKGVRIVARETPKSPGTK
jgi:uncharacterized protein YjbJ (UPF0337 family)